MHSLEISTGQVGNRDFLVVEAADEMLHWDSIESQRELTAPENVAPEGQADWISNWLPNLYLLLCALIATVFINYYNIDLLIAGLFHDPVSGDWNYKDNLTAQLIFRCAHIPVVILMFCGVCYVLRGLWQRRIDQQAQLGLFLFFGLVLGPGLIVNAICKETIGRPRPHDVQNFGGEYVFAKVGELGLVDRNSSFPCGHASMGFFLMLPGLIALKQKQKKYTSAWIALGLSAGIIIGFTRMMQGDHYFSDVLWSGLFVYYVAFLLLKYAIIIDSNNELTPFGHGLKWCLLRMTGFLMARNHFSRDDNANIRETVTTQGLETKKACA